MTTTVTPGSVAGRGGPVPVRDYGGTGAPFLWIHGGGFAAGDLDMAESDAVARSLADRGHRVRTVDYRLVPNFLRHPGADRRPSPNRFPAALEDVLDVLDDLTASTGTRPAIGGASAGAALASGAILRLRDEGQAPPPSVILSYGAFHSVLPPLSSEVRRRTSGLHGFFQFRPRLTARIVRNYLGEHGDPRHHAFAGGGDLRGFPPTLLLDADRDTLRASGEIFARELRDAQVEVDYRVAAGTRHGYLNRVRIPAYAEAVDAMDAWLTRHAAR